MGFRVSRDGGRWESAIIAVIGVVLLLLSMLHGLSHVHAPVELAMSTVPPTVLGLLVAYGGYWLSASDLRRWGRLVLLWMLVGMLFLAAVSLIWISYQALLGSSTLEAHTMVTNTMTGGAAIGFLIGSYDARRRQTKERLERSEEEYRGLVETSNDAIITCGEDRRIRQWNPAATEVFGYEREEALGRLTDMLVPEDLRERHVEAFDRFVETGNSSLMEGGETIELEALHRDGHRLPV